MAATKKKADTKKRGRDKIEQTDMGSVSALDLLEQDHREVERFFDEYEKLEDVDEKEKVALKICLALTVHTQIEEEILYPAVREAIEKDELNAIREAGIYAAHVVAAAAIAALEGKITIANIFQRMIAVLKKMHDANPSWGPLFVMHPGSIFRDFTYTRIAER